MRYDDYEASTSVANIVVDGSPNAGTVLTLSHWPGITAPEGLARDLSAEMAFAYLDDPPDHPPAEVVTNNHFDQDGLISIFALTNRDEAIPHRELLIDVAAAGDFATYRDRRAARAAMAMAARGSAETACSYSEFTHQLYTDMLPEVLAMTLDNEAYRELWEAEDAALTASEHALESGAVRIDEHVDVDLAVIRIDDDEPVRSGHRFGHEQFDGVHPMAIHNATERFRLLLIHGSSFRYVDRYETWVQYQSRPTLPRVDMRPLAIELTDIETSDAEWTAGAPDSLSPHLAPHADSSLSADAVTDAIIRHLRREVAEPE